MSRTTGNVSEVNSAARISEQHAWHAYASAQGEDGAVAVMAQDWLRIGKPDTVLTRFIA